MRVDGDAAAVIGDGQHAIGIELHVDPIGVSGHRFVHGIVDPLGEEVMHGLVVGAADIHARPTPDRLQPLQDLDIGRRIGRVH